MAVASLDSTPRQEQEHEHEQEQQQEREHEDEAVARLSTAFFSQPPRQPESVVWDDAPQPAMPRETRRAMHATLAILVGSVLAISGYAAYTHFVLPVPVELGAASGLPPPPVALPTPGPPAPVSSPAPVLAPQPAAVEPPRVPVPAPAVRAAPPLRASSAPLDPALSQQLAAASALYAAGRTKDALLDYERILGARPDVPQALSRVAYIQLNAKHDLRARELAERAVALDDTSSEGWIVLGAARGALGDHRGAREAYRTCASRSVGEYALECRRLAR